MYIYVQQILANAHSESGNLRMHIMRVVRSVRMLQRGHQQTESVGMVPYLLRGMT